MAKCKGIAAGRRWLRGLPKSDLELLGKRRQRFAVAPRLGGASLGQSLHPDHRRSQDRCQQPASRQTDGADERDGSGRHDYSTILFYRQMTRRR